MRRISTNVDCLFGLRRQSVAATALSTLVEAAKIWNAFCQSGVALRLPPQSKTWRQIGQFRLRAEPVACLAVRFRRIIGA
jgi:hypothetical protein